MTMPMRAALLGLLATAACTAPNPAFGDATSGGSTSPDASSEAPPAETSNTIGETTRGDDATTADATSTTGDDPSIATSDDENSVSDSDPIDDLGDDDGSTTESEPRRLWLFTAAVDGGAFADPAARDPLLAGFEQCNAAQQNLARDVCLMPPVSLIRTSNDPFLHPALADLSEAPVLSIQADPIAETLKDFAEGTWSVQTLYDAFGGGLEHLAEDPFATGGRTDGDPNCGEWLDAEGVMTIGDPDGEEGWLAVDEVSCATPVRILCICAG